jgi:hypothetical protein
MQALKVMGASPELPPEFETDFETVRMQSVPNLG